MIDKVFYPWERVWVPSTGKSVDEILIHKGYFHPDSDTRPLEYWQNVPCLILLGEPGMGKSAEWQRQLEKATEEVSQFVNLGDFSAGWDIVAELERYPKVAKWLNEPGSTLFLWLDSFDEALTHESKLAQTLKRMLDRWPLVGLHIRILSRTATWPAFFTDDLKRRFNSPKHEGNVILLQLAPLTLSHLVMAAEQERIEPRTFIDAIEHVEAIPLAIRPVTLGLLVKLWKAGKFGPNLGRRTELLEAGCKLLCEEEWDEQRTLSPLHDPDRRLRVAAHLALVMVGSNRRVLVYNETDDTELSLRISEVTGYNTLLSDKPGVFLERNLVKDVLEHTGLFAPSATHVSWAHQAYAEFLAAWALYKAQVPVAQLRNLFRSTVQGAGVIPSLRDTAVWLASLSAEFAAELLQLDPLTAMRADLLTSSSAQRERIVNHLFALTRKKHLYPRRAEAYLGRLAHPGIALQLTTVLENADDTPESKWLAYKIAEGCAVYELIPLLVRQTLNTTLPIRTRIDAIHVLRTLADENAAQQLRQLITAIPSNDKDDELRGNLLHILWPSHLNVHELLRMLTPQKNSRFLGSYHSFIDPAFINGLESGIKTEHLPSLLYWSVRHSHRQYESGLRDVVKGVCRSSLSVAWKHTDDPQVLPWLAFALLYLSKMHEEFIVPVDALPRYRVVQRWIKRNQLPNAYRLVRYHPAEIRQHAKQDVLQQAFLGSQDWPFLLELLTTVQSIDVVCKLFGVANHLLDGVLPATSSTYQERFSILYNIAETKGLLRQSEELDWAWAIDSNYARNNQERLHYERKDNSQKKNRARLTRRTNWRTYRLLIKLSDPNRTDTYNSWGKTWMLLTRSHRGLSNHFSTNVQEGYHWLRSSNTLKKRVIDLAYRVTQQNPPLIETSRINTVSSYQAANLAALILCFNERPDLIHNFSAEAWKPWVNLLLYAGIVSEGYRSKLLSIALTYHQRSIIKQIVNTTDFWQQIWTESNGSSRLLELLQDTSNDILRRIALFSITASQWPLENTLAVFKQLLTWRFRPAELFRDALLEQNPYGLQLHRLTYTVLRSTLFETDNYSQWWAMWQQVIRFGPETVRYLIGSVNGRPSWEGPVPASLSDTELAKLLTYLIEDLGVTEENGDNDWRSENRATRVRNFRNTTAKRLAGKATAEAWATLNKIAIQQSYPRWLTYIIEEAAETYSRAEWKPLDSVELIRFLRNAANRCIQSGEDLLDAVIESLDRLQQAMQGEPALANQFWYPANGLKDSRVRNGNKVVDENKVTDFVQFFLYKDLYQHVFSVKREVQLRDTQGSQKGQDLDLYIDAVAVDKQNNPIPGDRISVFVEAKHNDNREVTTALKGQLVNRYLRGHTAKFGLFLVYWHTQETGKSLSRGSLTTLREELVRQADAASVDGLSIRSYVLDIRLPDDQENKHT